MGRDRGRRIRSTEAWWSPAAPTYGDISGKVEWDEFASGATEISLYVRRLPVPNHTTVDVVRGDDVLLSCMVQKGKARTSARSEAGGHVPALEVGEVLVLRAGREVLARATVEAD